MWNDVSVCMCIYLCMYIYMCVCMCMCVTAYLQWVKYQMNLLNV